MVAKFFQIWKNFGKFFQIWKNFSTITHFFTKILPNLEEFFYIHTFQPPFFQFGRIFLHLNIFAKILPNLEESAFLPNLEEFFYHCTFFLSSSQMLLLNFFQIWKNFSTIAHFFHHPPKCCCCFYKEFIYICIYIKNIYLGRLGL